MCAPIFFDAETEKAEFISSSKNASIKIESILNKLCTIFSGKVKFAEAESGCSLDVRVGSVELIPVLNENDFGIGDALVDGEGLFIFEIDFV